MLTRRQLLDLYFLDARARLVDLAAFLDRIDRAPGDADFRLEALHQALANLQSREPLRAKLVLLAMSDPTTEPTVKAEGKGAVGAWNPASRAHQAGRS